MNDRWLLPQGIEESLPREAQQLEAMRRKLLDTYARWGYQLVMPPFIEYLDSLLTGTGHDLNTQTFQLVDQLKVALGLLERRERMDVGELGPGHRLHLSGGVELHGA